MMIASALHLNRSDVKTLKITDPYSIHRVIYDLFEDIRSSKEKQSSVSSGFLYADKGGDFNHRQILILSDRMPQIPKYGELRIKTIPSDFLSYDNYRFEVTVNPTQRNNASRKIIPIKGRENIAHWFINKSSGWGFKVNPHTLEVLKISVKRFEKKGHQVTQSYANLTGQLQVVDKERFNQSFKKGIGRGRSFGCGLLQIVPI